MKLLHITLGIMLLAAPAQAKVFNPGGYQDEDGVITIGNAGNVTEPYFATKALLLAKDGGLDISQPGRAWIRWAIKMQRKDGLFDRYCRKIDDYKTWETCNVADADDATLALWLELLYRMSPSTGLPEAWKDSAARAEKQLESLFDKETGIYHISKLHPVGLLMDNVEIYSSLRHIARVHKRFGDEENAARYNRKAQELRKHIYAVFWQEETRTFHISTQPRDENEFYPDRVAQIYPWLYSMPAPEGIDPRELFHAWIERNKDSWLDMRERDFPWGLVAVASLRLHQNDTAFCWQNRAEPFRYSSKWNILEEAALQQVELHLERHPPTALIACVENQS